MAFQSSRLLLEGGPPRSAFPHPASHGTAFEFRLPFQESMRSGVKRAFRDLTSHLALCRAVTVRAQANLKAWARKISPLSTALMSDAAGRVVAEKKIATCLDAIASWLTKSGCASQNGLKIRFGPNRSHHPNSDRRSWG